MSYTGVIIEESLANKDILRQVNIVSTEVEPVTEKHQTPWLSQWTLHTFEVPEEKAHKIAEAISKALESRDSWYADFKNDTHHFIVFRGKAFFVDRSSNEQYNEARQYGISLGIPEYQMEFQPMVRE